MTRPRALVRDLPWEAHLFWIAWSVLFLGWLLYVES